MSSSRHLNSAHPSGRLDVDALCEIHWNSLSESPWFPQTLDPQDGTVECLTISLVVDDGHPDFGGGAACLAQAGLVPGMLRISTVVPSWDEAVAPSFATRCLAAAGDLAAILCGDRPTLQNPRPGVPAAEQPAGDPADSEDDDAQEDDACTLTAHAMILQRPERIDAAGALSMPL